MHKPASSVNTIFFDFGGTLIYRRDPWEPLYQQGNQALLDELRRAGVELGPGWLPEGCQTFIDYYADDRGDGITEKTALVELQELLAGEGFTGVPVPVLRRALNCMYAITQTNWHLEADAIPTLDWLARRGYHLGMITNGSDDDNLFIMLEQFSLRSYFEVVTASSVCHTRKPDERIYRIALDGFGISPAQAVMVGDTPDADIFGANRMGIYSVWIKRRAETKALGPACPDAVINTLAELIPLFS